MKWDLSQLYTTGVLAVGVGIPGNFNPNRVVDAPDYVIWRKYLGTTYTQADYDIWRLHFGQPMGSGSSFATLANAPEPATLVLLTFATVGGFLRRVRAAQMVPRSR